MNQKNFFITAAIIFGLVAILHLVRAVNGLPLVIGIWELPLWLSWIAFVITGFMSYWGFKLVRRKG